MDFLHKLALILIPKRYRAQDYIVRAGEISDEMYFIVSGAAEVLSQVSDKRSEEEGGSVALARVTELRDGSFFGEVGVLFSKPRTASVRTVTETIEVICLRKGDLDDLLKRNPEVASIIAEEAEERLKQSEMRKKIAEEIQGKAGQTVGNEIDVEVTRERLKRVRKTVCKTYGRYRFRCFKTVTWGSCTCWRSR